jgi:hypothetical protein
VVFLIYDRVFGAIGYPLYVGSLWFFDRHGGAWFPYMSGAILGCTAGCLWTAAGFIQFAYAEEHEKALVGRFSCYQI